MDTLRQLTSQINVFVRFFQSINCLFYQIRWLESNVIRGSLGHLLYVAILLALVGYITYCNSAETNDTTTKYCSAVASQVAVLVLAFGLLGFLLLRRFQHQLLNSAATAHADVEEGIPMVPAAHVQQFSPPTKGPSAPPMQPVRAERITFTSKKH